MLRPNEKSQVDMIISGLAEILIRAAEGDEAIFALPGQGKPIVNSRGQFHQPIGAKYKCTGAQSLVQNSPFSFT